MLKPNAATTVALTVTAGAYTTLHSVGGLITIPMQPAASSSGKIASAQVICAGTQTCTYNLVLFSANPAATTVADTAAVAINTADFSKIIGVIHLTDVTTVGGVTINETTVDIAKVFSGVVGNLYALLEVVGTPTYAATTDVSVIIGITPD